MERESYVYKTPASKLVQVAAIAVEYRDRPDMLMRVLIRAQKVVPTFSKAVASQVAPSARITLAEALGEKPGTISTGRLVSALKRLGFYRAFDSDFSADLTIMEKGTELLQRLKTGGTLPMITSCCPA